MQWFEYVIIIIAVLIVLLPIFLRVKNHKKNHTNKCNGICNNCPFACGKNKDEIISNFKKNRN